ncbi:MAG: ferredoxin [Thermomicrobiales bacterium]
MKVIVDPDRCEGHARCVELAPEVFALDDDGYSKVILEHPDESLRAKVEAAVRLCPRQAILLIEDQPTGASAR